MTMKHKAEPRIEASTANPTPNGAELSARAKLASAQAAAALVKLEAKLRQLRSTTDLLYFIANEFRLFARAQQVFVFNNNTRGSATVAAVSGLSHVDKFAPLIVAVQELVKSLNRKHGLQSSHEIDLAAQNSLNTFLSQTYPMPNLLWVPFLSNSKQVLGGMLLARREPWSATDISIAEHLAGAAAYAWIVLRPQRIISLRELRMRKYQAAAAAAIVAVSFLPVSMTALAPVEVAPKQASIVTSGLDGVIEEVNVDPNTPVKAGAPLVRLSDTAMRSRYEIAEREVRVAQAREKRAAQVALAEKSGRHELAIAQAELQVKLAERDYAKEMLERTVVRAARDGVAFFAAKEDLIGRPVAAGEKLMDIVDPGRLQFNINLPVADAIVLKPGARVKVFLDFDPINPIDATLVRSAYKARQNESTTLVYRLIAESAGQDLSALRLDSGEPQKFSVGPFPSSYSYSEDPSQQSASI